MLEKEKLWGNTYPDILVFLGVIGAPPPKKKQGSHHSPTAPGRPRHEKGHGRVKVNIVPHIIANTLFKGLMECYKKKKYSLFWREYVVRKHTVELTVTLDQW